MGGEIITLHIGQAGVQISHALWELICAEHGINSAGRRVVERSGLDDLEAGREIVFREARNEKFVPRALLIDLEPTVIDEVRTGAYRELWNPLDMMNGKEDAASNFARGYYSQGRLDMFDVMDRIRRLIEQCEYFTCFKLLYSANGGTGSGLTSALCERLSDEYGKKHKFATTVYPSPGYSELMVEPYNALLHSSTNLTFCDCVVITDNEAMLSVSEESLKLRHEGFTIPNRVLANAVTTQFLSHRYKFIGQRNTHIDDLLINLIPYPRIHFPMMAFAPMISTSCDQFERTTAADLIRGVFQDSNQLLSVSALRRAYISCALLFRGAVTPLEACQAVTLIKGDRMGRARFVDWCPTGFKIGVNFSTPVQLPTHNAISLKRNCLSMIAGNLSIRDVWTGIGRRFDQLYEKRAFVHWYVAEGMEEGEFAMARELIQQLVEDYEAIAKDAEGAFFDEFTNQSQYQPNKSPVRFTPSGKQSLFNVTDANLNQAATLDEQNSLHTFVNNEENLSLDTNLNNAEGLAARTIPSTQRIRTDESPLDAPRKANRTLSRKNLRQRPPLDAPIAQHQIFSPGKMGNEGQQRSYNALIEPQLPDKMYGTNCSAALTPEIPMKVSQFRRPNHHATRCKRERNMKEEKCRIPTDSVQTEERVTSQRTQAVCPNTSRMKSRPPTNRTLQSHQDKFSHGVNKICSVIVQSQCTVVEHVEVHETACNDQPMEVDDISDETHGDNCEISLPQLSFDHETSAKLTRSVNNSDGSPSDVPTYSSMLTDKTAAVMANVEHFDVHLTPTILLSFSADESSRNLINESPVSQMQQQIQGTHRTLQENFDYISFKVVEESQHSPRQHPHHRNHHHHHHHHHSHLQVCSKHQRNPSEICAKFCKNISTLNECQPELNSRDNLIIQPLNPTEEPENLETQSTQTAQDRYQKKSCNSHLNTFTTSHKATADGLENPKQYRPVDSNTINSCSKASSQANTHMQSHENDYSPIVKSRSIIPNRSNNQMTSADITPTFISTATTMLGGKPASGNRTSLPNFLSTTIIKVRSNEQCSLDQLSQPLSGNKLVTRCT